MPAAAVALLTAATLPAPAQTRRPAKSATLPAAAPAQSLPVAIPVPGAATRHQPASYPSQAASLSAQPGATPPGPAQPTRPVPARNSSGH